jgi:RNA polymerase sigma factor (sigma-70 family)
MEIPDRLLLIPHGVVRKYRDRGVSRDITDELLSEANLALVQAYLRYDPLLDNRANESGARESYLYEHVKLSTRRAYLRIHGVHRHGSRGLRVVGQGHRAELPVDVSLAEAAVANDDPYPVVELNDLVAAVRRALDERRWRLLSRYFLQGVKLADIAEEEGVSYQRVQRLVSDAVADVSRRLGEMWQRAC